MSTRRKSKAITFSLPPQMDVHVRQVMQVEGRTISELILETRRGEQQKAEEGEGGRTYE